MCCIKAGMVHSTRVQCHVFAFVYLFLYLCCGGDAVFFFRGGDTCATPHHRSDALLHEGGLEGRFASASDKLLHCR